MGNCMSASDGGVEEGKSAGGRGEAKPTGAPADKESANPNRRKDPNGSSAVLVNGVYVFGYRTDLDKCYDVTSKVLGKGSYGTYALAPSCGREPAPERVRERWLHSAPQLPRAEKEEPLARDGSFPN